MCKLVANPPHVPAFFFTDFDTFVGLIEQKLATGWKLPLTVIGFFSVS